MKTDVIKEMPVLTLIGNSPYAKNGIKNDDVELYACVLNKAQVGDTWASYGHGRNSTRETAKVVYKDDNGLALLVISTYVSDDEYATERVLKWLAWIDLYNEQEEFNKMILDNHKKLMERDNKGGDVND